jgi:hypothetical protein
VVIVSPRSVSGLRAGVGDAYVTVTYETVGYARHDLNFTQKWHWKHHADAQRLTM